MNKEHKIARILCANNTGEGLHDIDSCENHIECAFILQARRLIEAGYINGADFVEWLKNRVISNRDYPHLAVALLCEDMREELSEFINEALQKYLKGE